MNFLIVVPSPLPVLIALWSKNSPQDLRLGFPKHPFPAGVPIKIMTALKPSSILTTWPAHLNLLKLITLATLGKRYKL